MKTKKCHPIKYVVVKTGLKAHNIRSWEERYQAVRPARSPTKRRLYADEDIQRLQLLKHAVDSGHRISSVANLSTAELQTITRRDASVHIAEAASHSGGMAAVSQPPDIQLRASIELALSHVVRLDAPALESVLSEAAVTLPRQAFLQQVIVPLFKDIGVLWQAGRLKVVNEHMASTIVRAMLWDMLRTVELSAAAPRIVLATPAGHRHECGALACALVAAEAGWQPYYFGPDLPSEEIVYTVKKVEAAALVLSLSHWLNPPKLIVELKKLRRLMDAELPILIGGNGVDAHTIAAEGLAITVVNDLNDLRKRIEKLS